MGIAYLTGTVNTAPVTHIEVDACQISPSASCMLNNVTENVMKRRKRAIVQGNPINATLNIPPGGSEYSFEYTFYDGEIPVLEKETTYTCK